MKLFNAPIVEINGKRGQADIPASEKLQLTIKVETVEPLEEPLVFNFVYTDGIIDK